MSINKNNNIIKPNIFRKEPYTRQEMEQYGKQERELGIEDGIKQERNRLQKQEKNAHSKLLERDLKNICEKIKNNLLKIKEKRSRFRELIQDAAKDRKKEEIGKLHEDNKKLWLAIYDKCKSPDQSEILEVVLSIFKLNSRNSTKQKSS